MEGLEGIAAALRKGCRLWSSVENGVAIVFVQTPCGRRIKAYGEHTVIKQAFTEAEEDLLSGGKKGEGKCPQRLIRSIAPQNDLEAWARTEQSLSAWWEDGEIVVELQRSYHVSIPQHVFDRVTDKGQTEIWTYRGLEYEISRIAPLPGYEGTSIRCLTPPEDGSNEFLFPSTRTGRGRSLLEAVRDAVQTPIELAA